MKEENIKSELTTYMWHIGRVLTELMSVSDSTNSPIIIETFQAAQLNIIVKNTNWIVRAY